MTREEFIANGVAWHGSTAGWQSALARKMGVDPRTIRRAVKDGPSDAISSMLQNLIGRDVSSPAEWICGDGSDGQEYLVHTASPRFVCRLLLDADYENSPDIHQDGDFHAGDVWMCGFLWLDRQPNDLNLWMNFAADALENM